MKFEEQVKSAAGSNPPAMLVAGRLSPCRSGYLLDAIQARV